MLYKLLDIFFVVFHTSVIIFNIFGWIWKRTRIANLGLLLLTLFSWTVLGAIVGSPGYCPLTDWHFRILEKLGHTDLPDSYIKYLADRITGLNFDSILVDKVTLWSFIAALTLSVTLNVCDLIRRRKKGLSQKL